MRSNILTVLKYLLFIIIPTISVLLCILFRIAQGENNEEIIVGVLLGIVLDFIYSIYLLITNKISNAKKMSKIIVSVVFFLIVVIIVGFVFLPFDTAFGERTYQSAKDRSESFLKQDIYTSINYNCATHVDCVREILLVGIKKL